MQVLSLQCRLLFVSCRHAATRDEAYCPDRPGVDTVRGTAARADSCVFGGSGASRITQAESRDMSTCFSAGSQRATYSFKNSF